MRGRIGFRRAGVGGGGEGSTFQRPLANTSIAPGIDRRWRIQGASGTNTLASGRKYFDVNNLTKRVRTLLVPFLRPKYL